MFELPDLTHEILLTFERNILIRKFLNSFGVILFHSWNSLINFYTTDKSTNDSTRNYDPPKLFYDTFDSHYGSHLFHEHSSRNLI